MKFVYNFIKNVFISGINSLEPRLNLAQSVPASLLSNCVLKKSSLQAPCALHIYYRFCALLIFPVALAKFNTYLSFYFSWSLNILWHFVFWKYHINIL